MNEWKMRGKECSPKETLEKIGKIYDRLGLSLNREDFDSGVENCYSCRLTLKGGTKNYIGTNGKGMSPELCLASANGEMIERLSNRIFVAMRDDDDKMLDMVQTQYPFYSPRDPEQPDCIRRLKEKIAASVPPPHILQSPMDLTESMLEQLAPRGLDGRYPTLPFYRPGETEPVYLPERIITMFASSNGMAAGNTLEEAMVEGISEILERYAQGILDDGEITPPQLPDEEIDKYPHIRRVIDQITKDPRYEVRVLDCSLGKGLPVVCGVIINKDTGFFGTKYGCQPNMGIALERVFTESLQGLRLEEASRKNTPDFHAYLANRRTDKWNAIKAGFGQVTSRLLMDEPDYEFRPWKSTEGKSNKEIMHELIRLMQELGADVYVHDASYLGFPVVHIYAAGIAELIPVDIIQLKSMALCSRVRKSFLQLDAVSEEQVREIALFARIKKGSILENTFSMISGLFLTGEAPGSPYEAEFLEAVSLYQLGAAEEAAAILQKLARNPYLTEESSLFLPAAAIYVDGIASGTPEEQVFSVVKKLCPARAEKVREAFRDRTKTLSVIYPSGNGKEPSELDESMSCYPAIHRLYARLVQEEKEHPVDPAEIIRVLSE